jgi:transcription antitermination factor NusG
MKAYIKVEPTHKFPATIPDLQELSDEFWKKKILSYILQYYKETDNKIIENIMQKERLKPRADIEFAIKKHIKNWFRKNKEFGVGKFGFILNDEIGNEGKKKGFYDFKIEHSYWKSYFPFECKNLGTTNLLNKYVFVETKDRIDGGMYRYFIDKYAVNQNFGGLIGFVIHKTDKSVIEQLIEKIATIYSDKKNGQLTDKKIVRKSIFNKSNTFDSFHLRHLGKSSKTEKIVLHHVIMDFINDDIRVKKSLG